MAHLTVQQDQEWATAISFTKLQKQTFGIWQIRELTTPQIKLRVITTEMLQTHVCLASSVG